MPVLNVTAGQPAVIPANTIPAAMYVYVMGQNSAARYSVQVGAGPNWNYARPSGNHERIVVNDQSVQVFNNGPATIQLLYPFPMNLSATGTGQTELSVLTGNTGADGAVAGNTAEDAMKTLTAQWYNAVVNGCGLNPMNFQLYQAHLPLGQVSEDLWNIFDAVPPLSITHYYNPSQLNILSQNYGGVINHLNPQDGDKFETAMRDYYPMWVAYLKTNPTMPKGGMLELFKNWSDMNMPPDRAQMCYTLYQQIANDVVVVAVQKWINMQNAASNPGIAAYNQTIEDLTHALDGGEPQTFALNSETESSDTSHTWAQGEVAGGIFDFFWGSDAQYEKWTESISEAGVTIDVSFDKLVTFAAGPLFQPSTDPILSQYTPWYYGKALSLAYHHQDNTVWQHGAPTWADTFGAQGDLQRTCAALVVVDGITVTTESSMSVAKDEQDKFKAAVAAGFFPFFEAEGSGGWEHTTTFNDNAGFKISSTCPQGNPQVIGVLVSDISSIFTLAAPKVGAPVAAAPKRQPQPVGALVRK